MPFEQHVVGIAEGHELSARCRQPRIACRGYPLLGLANELDPRPVGGRDVCSCVGGAIVDDDDLQVRIRLAQRRRDRHAKRSVRLIRDGDERHAGVID